MGEYNMERLSCSIVPAKHRSENMKRVLAYYTKKAEVLSLVSEEDMIAAQNRLASISFADPDFLERFNGRIQ